MTSTAQYPVSYNGRLLLKTKGSAYVKIGGRAFAHYGTIWNNLPQEIRLCNTIKILNLN